MKKAILVTRPHFGWVEPENAEFGEEMLDKFFHALESRATKPDVICFYTAGVTCLSKGKPWELSLRVLDDLGVRILACGTCVDKYGVRDDLVVGEIGTMADIADVITTAADVVTI